MRKKSATKTFSACFFLFLILLSANPAAAATLSYMPEAVSLTVPAGSQYSTRVEIAVPDSAAFTQFIRTMSEIRDGNLPAEWISASPAGAFVRKGCSASATLTITVPPDTPAGIYGGYFVSRAQASHEAPDPGSGVFISVDVPSACSGVAEIRLDDFGPSILWPPDHSLQAVTLRGSVLLPAGCALQEAAYRIEDEYGVYSASGLFTVAVDGSFTIVLPVEASRKGQDRDGREYAITVTVRNEAGTGSSGTMKVLVPHDQRSAKLEQNE